MVDRREMTNLVHQQISVIGCSKHHFLPRSFYRAVGLRAVAEALVDGNLISEAAFPTKLSVPHATLSSTWKKVGSYLHGSLKEAESKLVPHG